ncbi:penicillin-binding protein 2 [Rickettsiella massiliensis]|uniref:penicillin-binding protein 2 n=1 Tax=Rickettsiella massiliensis TaxID=676517 RepID=UPI00029B297C|nr:penicillin-binding protein 2 [Rickettsiella massiliensis]
MLKPIHTFKNSRQEYGLFRKRLFLLFLILLLLSGFLLGRLIYLQIFQQTLYTTLARQNQLGLVPIEPNRGLIYDRKGVILAENKPIFNLMVTPDRVPHLDETIEALSQIIKIDAEDLKQFQKQRRLHHRFEPIPLRVKLSESEVAHFATERYRFPGVHIQAQMIRFYPKGDEFAATVGYMGRINEKELQTVDPVNYSASNFIGKTGVEKSYELQLHGTVGYQQIETNVHGQIVRTLKQTQPIPGKDLTLTLDSGLQQLAQQALGEQKGAIVALDPTNGEVLAFVSNPSFDPNLFVSGINQKNYDVLRTAPGDPLYNRALRGFYHPGSTIKPFLSIGALLDGVITPSFVVHDTGEFQLNEKGRIYHNFQHHAYGNVDLLKALTVSSDIYFYNLSLRMGIDRIYTTLKKFGFGTPVGIDLPDEGGGVAPSPEWKEKTYGESWYPGDTLNTGIGQGFLLATPLQLAFAVGTIATGGEGWVPHVVLNWRAKDGKVTFKQPRRSAHLETPEPVLSFIRNALQHVVSVPGGTATRFFYGVPYTVAGKTGTAQVFSMKKNERYNKNSIAVKLRDNSLFIAFAPIDHPKIALAIVIQNSFTPAASVARKLLDYYLIPRSPIVPARLPTLPDTLPLPSLNTETTPDSVPGDQEKKKAQSTQPNPTTLDTKKLTVRPQPQTEEEFDEDEDEDEDEDD